MKLPKIAIENYQFTIVVVLLLVLSGIVSFISMPRSEDPLVSKPGSSVVVLYPGAGPEDMEQLIASPIEESINELDDIKKINTRCEDGLAVIRTEFLAGSDPDEKFSDVNEKINSLRNDLPEDILSIKTIKWTIEDTNFLQLALVSDRSGYREMEKIAERLKKKLEKIYGIRRVKLWGFPEQEVRVALDLEKIARMRIPLQHIIGAVKAANMNIPGGTIDAGSRRFVVRTSGSYDSIAGIKNTVIHSSGTKIVYLKDVADVFLAHEDNNYFARFNGKRALLITANQKQNTNIFDIIGAVKEEVAAFQNKMPQSMQLYYVFDQSESVERRLSTFFSSLLQGIALVGLVILVAVGLRGSIIVMLAIPISILIAIGFVDLSGYGIQQMSIAGLVITLGLLVDNAIVVTENIARFIKKGENNRDAAVKGSRQIAWAIVSATATTVLAFLPIVMMQDVSGDFIRSMPVTVIYTLAASLFIALTFTPFLSVKILKKRKQSRTQAFLTGFVEKRYRKWLGFSVKHPKLIVTLALAVLFGSLSLSLLIGVSFFPRAGKNQFFINVTTPEGTGIDRTDRAARYVESVLSTQQEVESVTANVGHSNPRIYYNIHEKQGKSNYAHLFVLIKKSTGREQMQAAIVRLREEFGKYAGAKIEIKELEQGPPFEAPIAIIAIFAVLVLQFKSFSQPMIVFAALPLAIIGSILALLITGNTFSFTAFIGLTSLVGIVVNNSIILVDYTNQLRREGKELLAALKEAGETRFMPIILTTGTTIGGLLPLTIGGGTIWAPMGWAIIGGLITSTVLTLIVVPVLYKLFTNERRT